MQEEDSSSYWEDVEEDSQKVIQAESDEED
jgi:hypothetical protein